MKRRATGVNLTPTTHEIVIYSTAPVTSSSRGGADSFDALQPLRARKGCNASGRPLREKDEFTPACQKVPPRAHEGAETRWVTLRHRHQSARHVPPKPPLHRSPINGPAARPLPAASGCWPGGDVPSAPSAGVRKLPKNQNLHDFRTFPLSPRNGEVRREAGIRRGLAGDNTGSNL